MTKEKFDGLWKNGFERKIDEIKSCCSDKILFDENRKEFIFEKYSNIRDFIKERYMKNKDGLLDRHKVAAIMMKAILIVEPFQLSKKDNGEILDTEEIPILAWFANEVFAIYCANVIVSSFLINEEDTKMKDVYKKGLVIPDCRNEDSYLLQLAKELYYNKVEGHFDVFAFANILFLLEQYTIAINSSQTSDLSNQNSCNDV